MHTIKLQIEDNIYDEILKSGMDIQDELKLALHRLVSKKNTYINSEQYKADKKYFKNALDEIESGDAKLLNQEEYDKEMNEFMKAL